MRAKTFGRRKRNILQTDIALSVDSSSPTKPQWRGPSNVLSEKSENILGKFRPSTDSPVSQKVSKVIAREVDHDGHHQDPASSVHSTPEICNSSTSQSSDQDDLLLAINKLQIKDSSSQSPPVVQSLDIKSRPAKATRETLDYLSLLLACKNVSECIEDFHGWADERSCVDITKVGEGSFGEVFRATSSSDTVILKLMPLNARKGKGSRSYTSVASAVNEVTLLDKMQKIPGFVEFRGACVLQGSMSPHFVKFWNNYLETGRTVESKDPNKTGTYPSTQLWLLIEMSDAGRSLEPGQYRPPGCATPKKSQAYLSIQRVWDIWWQTVKALAKAEVLYGFEHRDLHGGNICVVDLQPEIDVGNLEKQKYKSKSPFGIHSTGVQVTLIDYSLSRASFGEDKVFYYDFQKDKKLLEGTGDLQYDMYRHMAAVIENKPCKEFHPRTNVVWLYYILNRLLGATLQSRQFASQRKQPITVGQKMLEILQDIEASIDPKNLTEWAVTSAGDLLDVGIGALWFTSGDVVDV